VLPVEVLLAKFGTPPAKRKGQWQIAGTVTKTLVIMATEDFVILAGLAAIDCACAVGLWRRWPEQVYREKKDSELTWFWLSVAISIILIWYQSRFAATTSSS
jgi:hypothetical protein